MADVWAGVAGPDAATQDRLAEVLETRGAEPRQREMRRAFLSEIGFPAGAAVLDVGCGTGVLTRALAGLPDVGAVVGVDLAPSLLARAREMAAGLADVRFEEADARALPFPEGAFDVVVFDSTLSHVPEPERALAEAFRVLRPGGRLAAFDGDYATTTVALSEHEPLRPGARPGRQPGHERLAAARLTRSAHSSPRALRGAGGAPISAAWTVPARCDWCSTPTTRASSTSWRPGWAAPTTRSSGAGCACSG